MNRGERSFRQTKTKKNPKALFKRFWAYESEVSAIVESYRTGKPVELIGGLKWTDALDRWLDSNPQMSGNHIESVQRNINFLLDFAGNKELTIEATSKGLFRAWLDDRNKTGAAAANKSREIRAVARFCCEQLDLLPNLPDFMTIGKYKVQEVKREPIPLEYIGDYLKACEKVCGKGLRLIIEFMLFTGVRSTEACNIAGSDIDIKSGVITVMQKAAGAGPRPAEVVLDEYVSVLIKEAQEWRKCVQAQFEKDITKVRKDIEKLAADPVKQGKAYRKLDRLGRSLDKLKSHSNLFFCDSGAPWDRNSLRRRWLNACTQAGLEYFVPHELRHTHATIAGEANFSEKFLQAALRWEDPTMAKRYVHNTTKMATEVESSVRGTLAKALEYGVIKAKKIDKDSPVIVRKVEGITREILITCDCGTTIRLIPAKMKRNIE